MNVVLLCSTNGSVFTKYVQDFLPNIEFHVVSDRECGAVETAKSNGIKHTVFETNSGAEFSSFLAEKFNGDNSTLFISFYTRLLKGRFIEEHSGRIVNFHPSILPACPGQNGFGDTIASGSMFVGSTVHLVDDGLDTGLPLIQAAYPRDPSLDINALRHRVFLQQVVSLAQVIEWYAKDRVVYKNGLLQIKGAKYCPSEFSPNLEEPYLQYFSEAVVCH